MSDQIKKGIRFAVSRMGLQFSYEQQEKYADDIYAEYCRMQDKKERISSLDG